MSTLESLGKHIAYRADGRWVPWCELFPRQNWPRQKIELAQDEICPDCLELALEEIENDGETS